MILPCKITQRMHIALRIHSIQHLLCFRIVDMAGKELLEQQMRTYHQRLLWALATPLISQTIPPAPQIQGVSGAVGVNTLTVHEPMCLYGGTACGLSDCGCWWQIYRAQCSSSTSCPAITSPAGTYINPTNTAVSSSSTDSAGTGTNVVFTDTDSALVSGTTWQYYMTVNYAQYTPVTYSPASNISGPVVLGGTTSATTIFSVYLDYDNASCNTGTACKLSTCTCSTNVYKAICSSSTACPTYPNGTWSKLASVDSSNNSYVNTTVSATNTHFHYKDDGAIVNNLKYNTIYTYVATNTYTADPTSTESKPGSPVIKGTPDHMAAINWSNPSCNTTTPACTFQVYRVVCTSSNSCPTYPSGTWTKLNMTSGLTTTITTQGTSWRYADMDPTLAPSTTYSWVATASWNSTTSSPASAPFVGTTISTLTRRVK